MRASDTVARVGGDEFVILSLDARNEEQAAALVGRRHAPRRPYRWRAPRSRSTPRWAGRCSRQTGRTSDERFARGRADVRHQAETGETTSRRLDGGINKFELALESREVVVHYQPVLELLQRRRPHGGGAVRRQHPDRGVPRRPSPSTSSAHQVIRALTLHVVAEALNHATAWRSRGHELGVSVNVPYRTLDDAELITEGLAGLTASSEVPPQALTLESLPPGRRRRARPYGVEPPRGGSEWAYRWTISDEPPRHCPSSAAARRGEDRRTLRPRDRPAPRRLGCRECVRRSRAHQLADLDVVAEGVESRETWDLLCRIGCDYAQGFYIAAPMSVEKLTDWLEHSWPAVAELVS